MQSKNSPFAGLWPVVIGIEAWSPSCPADSCTHINCQLPSVSSVWISHSEKRNTVERNSRLLQLSVEQRKIFHISQKLPFTRKLIKISVGIGFHNLLFHNLLQLKIMFNIFSYFLLFFFSSFSKLLFYLPLQYAHNLRVSVFYFFT